MAFTVTTDHDRQERVWEQLSHSHTWEPYFIRRQLTEGAVRASDRRAQFVGVDATKRPVVSSCAIYFSMTTVAGCRIRRCSTGL